MDSGGHRTTERLAKWFKRQRQLETHLCLPAVHSRLAGPRLGSCAVVGASICEVGSLVPEEKANEADQVCTSHQSWLCSVHCFFQRTPFSYCFSFLGKGHVPSLGLHRPSPPATVCLRAVTLHFSQCCSLKEPPLHFLLSPPSPSLVPRPQLVLQNTYHSRAAGISSRDHASDKEAAFSSLGGRVRIKE